MNKIYPTNINKFRQVSKNVTKPLVACGLLASCAFVKQPNKDSFKKENCYLSPKELQPILEKRGLCKETIEKIITFQSKGIKEKVILKNLLELKQLHKKSLPLLSFIKIKKEKNIIEANIFLDIIKQISENCSDIDFALELINLQKEKKEGKITEKVPFWNNGFHLLDYIKGIENPKLKNLMQKYIHTDLEKFAELDFFCRAKYDNNAFEKYQYIQKITGIKPPKYIGTISVFSKTNVEDFIKKINILHDLTDSLDKDLYFSSANNHFSPEDWEKIVKTCRENNEKEENILETLTNIKNNDIDLWEKLYKNPYLKGLKIYHIANDITDNNKDFILSLCEQKDFPKDILSGIAYRTSHSNNKIMYALCNDKTIDKKQILKYYDQFQNIPYIDFTHLEISSAYKFLDVLKDYDENIKKFAKNFNVPIDEMITRLNNYLALEKPVIKIEQKQEVEFFKNIIANNDPEAEKVLQTFNFAQFGKKGLPLKYSRKEFSRNINSLLKELNNNEQNRVCSHFGLIKGELGGFNGLYNNTDYKNSSATVKELDIAKKIQAEINKFTLENEVLISDPLEKRVLDGLIKGLPEFTTLVGKEQHGEHRYSVDIHSLLVLQKAMNNPLYKTLNNSDKTIIKFSALLHDIGKREGIIDRGHAKTSSEYTRSILKRTNLPEKIKHKIIVTVDSHHWFENFCRRTNSSNSTVEMAACDVFLNAHSPNDLKVFEILAKSDFQSVSPTFHLDRSGVSSEKEFDKYIEEKMNLLEKLASEKLFKYSNFLKTTKFSTNLFPEEKIKIDGKKTSFKVLNLHKISDDDDLRKYGFGCSKKDDLRFLVHMTHCDKESLNAMRKITNNPLMHKMWSTSLIKPSHNNTYMARQYGGIFDVDSSKIVTAYPSNISSGTRKNENDYKILINSNIEYNIENRSYLKTFLLKNLQKEGFKLSEKDYINLSRHILSFDDLDSIKDFKIKDKTINAKIIINSIKKAQEKLFIKETQNEIVGIDLKLKALVAKVEKIEDCDPEFLRFARDNKLDIILI